MGENGLIRKLRLISKFMASQPRKQTIMIPILPNISRSKANQTMKFGQLIGYNLQSGKRRLVPDLCLFFIKALCEVNASGLHLSFNTFRQPSTWTRN